MIAFLIVWAQRGLHDSLGTATSYCTLALIAHSIVHSGKGTKCFVRIRMVDQEGVTRTAAKLRVQPTPQPTRIAIGDFMIIFVVAGFSVLHAHHILQFVEARLPSGVRSLIIHLYSPVCP